MTKIPDSLKIGYQNVKVGFADLHDSQGMYFSDRGEIRIKEGMDKRENLNTLIHECIHACIYTYGLKSSFDSDDHEEKVVNALGNAMTDVFIRNPSFICWIRDHAKE